MKKFVTPREIIENRLFEESGNLILEIGCGNGEFLVQLHEAKPDALIFGIDISNFALRKAISRIKNLKRAFVTKSEGRWFLTWIVPEGTLTETYVLFPDPWPGREKRRLIDENFINTLAQKLKNNGSFFFATDVEDYFLSVKRSIEKSPFFRLTTGTDAFYTKYERKWKSMGKKTFSLSAEKVESPPPGHFKVYLNKPIKTSIKPSTLEKLKGLELRTEGNFFKILEVYRDNGKFLLKTVFRMKNMGQKQFFRIENGEIDLLPVQLEIFPDPLFRIIKSLFG